MDGAVNVHARAQIDRLVRQVRVVRKAAVGPVAITHQQRIPGKHGLQCASQRGFCHLPASHYPVQRLPGTVPSHQNAHQLV